MVSIIAYLIQNAQAAAELLTLYVVVAVVIALGPIFLYPILKPFASFVKGVPPLPTWWGSVGGIGILVAIALVAVVFKI